MTTSRDPIPLDPLTAQDAELCRAAVENIGTYSDVQACHLTLTLGSGERVTVPMPAVTPILVIPLLKALLANNPVTFISRKALLSISQVAECLHVSPDFVRQLLTTDQLPASEGASGHQIRYEDLRNYQHRQQQESEQALRKLMEVTERLGLYDTKK